ncbi:hypothetical protein GCM10022419_108200 [Nonomuraea rosea]|uniref:Uncharacterized protein n=1 Tax=Nonomuraea rosea TaxID=638574 RepID=A0ABP6ZEV0_9ACTN
MAYRSQRAQCPRQGVSGVADPRHAGVLRGGVVSSHWIRPAVHRKTSAETGRGLAAGGPGARDITPGPGPRRGRASQRFVVRTQPIMLASVQALRATHRCEEICLAMFTPSEPLGLTKL